MKIKLVGEGGELTKLEEVVRASLASLGLLELVTLETTNDAAYKMELGITGNPALCIEETSIDFKDMIFEGIIPEQVELDSMFTSILGSSEMEGDSGCSGACSSGGCGTGGCGSHGAGDGCSTSKHEHI